MLNVKICLRKHYKLINLTDYSVNNIEFTMLKKYCY